MDSLSHFLDETVQRMKDAGLYEQLPAPSVPYYNSYGDCVQYVSCGEETIIQWIDEHLSLYLSAKDRRPIGFKLKDVKALRDEFLCDGIQVSGEFKKNAQQEVEISYLMMVAFKKAADTDPAKVKAWVDSLRLVPENKNNIQLPEMATAE